jgi:uncharacterized RDD family membrane protein YckC
VEILTGRAESGENLYVAYTGSYSAAPAVPRDPTAVIGRRIVAFLVDTIIVSAIMIAVGAALAKSYSNAPSDACQILRDQGVSAPTCFQSGSHVYVLNGGETFTVWFLGFLVWLGNYVLLQGATGATVGKFMLGLRCVNAQGETCGMGRAFVRSLLLLVDDFFCFLVGLITVNVTHPHQRVGDLVAKTYVVATSDVGVPFAAPVPVAATTWGQPPPVWGQQQPPAWGQPQQQPPAWGQPPAQQPPAYGQPAQQPAAWGAPPPEQSPWGAPPAAPPPPPAWDPQPPAQQPPPPPPPVWDAPAQQQAAPPPQQPPPAAPPSWGAPPEQQAPPPSPPAPETAPPPAQPSAGESWWDRAVESDGDDEPTQ